MKKPKVLFMELLDNNYGNRRYDLEMIRIMKEIVTVTVAYPEGWFESLPQDVEKISYKNIELSKTKNSKSNNYLLHYRILKIAQKIDRENQFDYIFFSSYHSYCMCLSRVMFKNLSRIFVVNHNNIDFVDKSLKSKIIYKLYCTKINHIVYEAFIGEHLVNEYSVPKDNIFVLPHPMNRVVDEEKKYDCVGISNSNDDAWIKEIIEYESQTSILKENNKKLILRSKSEEFDDGGLKVFKGYLTDEQYYSYISSAKNIFLPFELSFKYRMSGSVIDAFSGKTKVVGSKIPLFEAYEKEYSAICRTIERPTELVDIIVGQEYKDNQSCKDFDAFALKHSDAQIIQVLKKMFGLR